MFKSFKKEEKETKPKMQKSRWFFKDKYYADMDEKGRREHDSDYKHFKH